MYVKLFGSILHSSIWSEPHHVRIVWITLLALADENGWCHASLPGLARAACVTMEECEQALEILRSEDQYDSTGDGGRRIVETAGGWNLTNHSMYREVRTQRQLEDALRKRREYAKNRDLLRRSPNESGDLTDDAEISSKQKQKQKEGLPTDTPSLNSQPSERSALAQTKRLSDYSLPDFDAWWKVWPRKVGKGAASKAYTKACSKVSGTLLMARAQDYADAVAGWPPQNRKFIPHPATWLNQERWDDDLTDSTGHVSTPDEKLKTEAARMLRDGECTQSEYDQFAKEKGWS